MFPAYFVAERVKNPSPSAAEFTAEQELIGCVNGLFYERVKGRTKCQEKIAVITARADDRTQKDIICGIAEEAFAADTDMVVFSNIYNHWIRGEFLNFENVIYDFFDPSGFGGVIVTAEAFPDISRTMEFIFSILVNFLCRIIVLTQKKLNLRLVNCDLPSISPFAK